MAIRNGKSTSAIPGLYLKRKDAIRDAILQMDTVNSAPTTTSGYYYLYVDTDGSLKFNNGSTITTLGAAGGGGGSPGTWDGVYASDKTLLISSTTLTFDLTHATNNGLTLTASGAGTGHLLQITNSGTGKDINGTSGTWSVDKDGNAVFNTVSFAGDADSTGFTLTAGDFVMSDGKMAITNADNEATFSVTNNGLTSAAALALAGSGVFTGSTTTSFVTITPSGLTTGTAVYLPVAALTEGKALHVVANALTSGIVVDVTSSATAITGAGRLLNIAHSGATSTSGVLAEFSTAANDETVLLKLTASDILALGTILQVSGSSVTTGSGITIADLDALTDGKGLHIASAATAISSTGNLLLVNHTGVTTTSGVLAQFTTAATDETVVVGITASSAITSVGLKITDAGTAMTSGSLLRISTGSTAAVATNGIVSIRATAAYTSTSNAGLLDVRADSVTTGATVVNISATAATTSVGLRVVSSGTGLTSGSLALFTSGTTGAIATNGAVSVQATADFSSTSNQGFFGVIANSTTAGTVASISATAATTGVGLYVISSGTGMTSGSLIRATTGTTGAVATNGVVSIRATGAYTSTSNAGLLDVQASAATGAATVVNIKSTAAAQTAVTLLNVENSGFTTGYTGDMVILKTPSTTGACKVLSIDAAASTVGIGVNVLMSALTTNGVGVKVDLTAATAGNAFLAVTSGAYTGTGLAHLSAGAMTTGVLLQLTSTTGLTSGSLLRATTSTAGALATNGAVSITGTGAFTSTNRVGLLEVQANATTGGTVAHVISTSLTDGTLLSLEAVEATLTTGKYIQCYDGAAADFTVAKYGATVIAGNAQGTAALTVTTGDLVVTAGNATLGGKVIFSGTETIAAGNPGALSLNKVVHYVDADAGGDTFTLADGVDGQIAVIIMTSSTGTATITPANMGGYTSATLNADGDSVVLMFMDTEWFIIGGHSYGTA